MIAGRSTELLVGVSTGKFQWVDVKNLSLHKKWELSLSGII